MISYHAVGVAVERAISLRLTAATNYTAPPIEGWTAHDLLAPGHVTTMRQLCSPLGYVYYGAM